MQSPFTQKVFGRQAKERKDIQCTPDLVTSYLVTNPDLVTILQKTVFLLHKNILFSDNLVFSDPSI